MRYTSLIALATVLAACEGPQGPVGPAGADGNANVTTGTFTVAPTAWTNGFWYFPVDGGTQANPTKVSTVNVSAITADIMTNGAVLVYLRVPSSGTGASDQWTLLPFHQGGFGTGYLVSIKAAAAPGQIRVGYAHDVTDAATTPPDVYTTTLPTYEFKYVVISGVSATAAMQYARLSGPDDVVAAVRRDRR